MPSLGSNLCRSIKNSIHSITNRASARTEPGRKDRTEDVMGVGTIKHRLYDLVKIVVLRLVAPFDYLLTLLPYKRSDMCVLVFKREI